MNKYWIIFLVAVSSLFAEVKIDRGVAAVFPYEFWDFEEYRHTEICQTSLRLDSADGSLGCFNKDNICQSLLDSSVFFYWRQVSTFEAYGYFYHLSDASHSILDVIVDEFRQYRNCGLIVATEAGMDSIEFFLKRDLQPALETVTFDISTYFTYSYERSLAGSSMPAYTDVGEIPVPQVDYVDSVVKVRNGESLSLHSFFLRNNPSTKDVVRKFPVPMVWRDGKFFLVNGRLGQL